MYGVEGSKHWAQDIIYRVLSDGKYHTFDEIFLEITEKEKLDITRLNLSVVISRLRKKRGDIVQYKYGVFKLEKNPNHI